MNETDAYAALRPHLQALGLDPQRVENGLGAGTPDVSYTSGVIEMKYEAAWPVRPDTPLTVKSFVSRKAQVPWLTRRWLAGGPSWIMLRVAEEYLLFAGLHARAVRAGQTQAYLKHTACWRTERLGAADWPRLRAWLTWDYAALPPEAQVKLRQLRSATVDELDPTIVT